MPSELRIILPPVGPTRPAGAERARFEPPGEGHAPLSKRQIISIVTTARAAHEALIAAGSIETGTRFDDWRREAMRDAVRKISLKHCTQRDYMPLLARFQDRAGESGDAFNTLMHAQGNPKRVAMHHLAKACEEKGVPMAYPAAICARQFKCSLEDASHKQIWTLTFTVRNRREGAVTRRKVRTANVKAIKAALAPAKDLPAKLIIRRPARAPKPAAPAGELPF